MKASVIKEKLPEMLERLAEGNSVIQCAAIFNISASCFHTTITAARKLDPSIPAPLTAAQKRKARKAVKKLSDKMFKEGARVVVAGGGYKVGAKGVVNGYRPPRLEMARGFVDVQFCGEQTESFTDSYIELAA
ncbi:MAG: hypothetical protein R8M45_05875 [Ghiorsea sp.]